MEGHDSQIISTGYWEEIVDSVALVADETEKDQVIKLTHEVAEKSVAISQMEILAMHWENKCRIMEAQDRDNRDRINALSIDFERACADIKLLQAERATIAGFEGRNGVLSLEELRGHQLQEAIEKIAHLTTNADKERRDLQLSVDNVTKFNLEQKAHIVALQKNLDELAHQLAMRTVLFEARLKAEHQTRYQHEHTISDSREETIRLQAQLAQLTTQLEGAYRQRTELEISLKETVTTKTTLEAELEETTRQRDDYSADLQRAIEQTRDLEQTVQALKGTEHLDLDQFYGSQMERLRQEYAGQIDSLRRELNDARQRLTTETNTRLELEQDNDRLLTELRDKEEVIVQYGETLRHGELEYHQGRRANNSRQLLDNSRAAAPVDSDNIRDSEGSLLLRRSRDLSGHHPDDLESVVSKLTEEGAMHEGDGEVLRSSLSDAQMLQQPPSVPPPQPSDTELASSAVAAGAATAVSPNAGKAGRYSNAHGNGGDDSVRNSLDSGVYSEGSGTGTDNSDWLRSMLDNPAQQPAQSTAPSARTATGIAFASTEPAADAALVFNAETQVVYDSFQIIAEQLQRPVPSHMPTQSEFVFNELVNACVFDCDTEQAARQLYTAFEGMLVQMEQATVRRLHQQPPDGAEGGAAGAGYLTPSPLHRYPHGPAQGGLAQQHQHQYQQQQRKAAVVHDTSTEYSPGPGHGLVARPSPSTSPFASPEVVKELDHLRNQVFGYQRQLQAAHHEIHRLSAILHRSPLSQSPGQVQQQHQAQGPCLMCAHREQREQKILHDTAVQLQDLALSLRSKEEECARLADQMEFLRSELAATEALANQQLASSDGAAEAQVVELTSQMQAYKLRCEQLERDVAALTTRPPTEGIDVSTAMDAVLDREDRGTGDVVLPEGVAASSQTDNLFARDKSDASSQAVAVLTHAGTQSEGNTEAPVVVTTTADTQTEVELASGALVGAEETEGAEHPPSDAMEEAVVQTDGAETDDHQLAHDIEAQVRHEALEAALEQVRQAAATAAAEAAAELASLQSAHAELKSRYETAVFEHEQQVEELRAEMRSTAQDCEDRLAALTQELAAATAARAAATNATVPAVTQDAVSDGTDGITGAVEENAVPAAPAASEGVTPNGAQDGIRVQILLTEVQTMSDDLASLREEAERELSQYERDFESLSAELTRRSQSEARLRTEFDRVEAELELTRESVLSNSRLLKETETELQDQQRLVQLLNERIAKQAGHTTAVEADCERLHAEIALLQHRLQAAGQLASGTNLLASSTAAPATVPSTPQPGVHTVEESPQISAPTSKEYSDVAATLQFHLNSCKTLWALMTEMLHERENRREDAGDAEEQMAQLRSSFDGRLSQMNDQITRVRDLDLQLHREHHQTTVTALQAQHDVVVVHLRERLTELQSMSAAVQGANAELQQANGDLTRRNQELQHEQVLRERSHAQQLEHLHQQVQHLQEQLQLAQHHVGARHDGHGEEKGDGESVITVGKDRYDEQVQVIAMQSARLEQKDRELTVVQERYATTRNKLTLLKNQVKAIMRGFEEEKRNVVEWARQEHMTIADEFERLLRENREAVALKYKEAHLRWQEQIQEHYAADGDRPYGTEYGQYGTRREEYAHSAERREEKASAAHRHHSSSSTRATEVHLRQAHGHEAPRRPEQHATRSVRYDAAVEVNLQQRRHRANSTSDAISSSDSDSSGTEDNSDSDSDHRGVAAPKVTTTPPRSLKQSRRGASSGKGPTSATVSVPSKGKPSPAPSTAPMRHPPDPTPPPPSMASLDRPSLVRLSDQEALLFHTAPPEAVEATLRASQTTDRGASVHSRPSDKHAQPPQVGQSGQPSYLKPTQTTVARIKTAKEEAAAPPLDIHPPSSAGDIRGRPVSQGQGQSGKGRTTSSGRRRRSVSHSLSPSLSPMRPRPSASATAVSALPPPSMSVFGDRAAVSVGLQRGTPPLLPPAATREANPLGSGTVRPGSEGRPREATDGSRSRQRRNHRHRDQPNPNQPSPPLHPSQDDSVLPPRSSAEEVRRSFADDDYQEYLAEKDSRRRPLASPQMPPKFEQIVQQTKERLRR